MCVESSISQSLITVQASLEMDLGMMLGSILLFAAWICHLHVPTSNQWNFGKILKNAGISWSFGRAIYPLTEAFLIEQRILHFSGSFRSNILGCREVRLRPWRFFLLSVDLHA